MTISTHPDRGFVASPVARRVPHEDLAPLGHEPAMGTPMIAVRGLTKRYGSVAAVEDLSFEVHAGTVVGFLGRNGAGKSTTLKMLAGLSAATSGTATIAGVPYRSLPRPMQVAGFGLSAEAFQPSLSGERALQALASRIGVGRGRVREVLELVELASAAGRQIGKYSLGMRQRLVLAAALLGDLRRSCSMSRPTGWTRRGTAGCVTFSAPVPARVARYCCPPTCSQTSPRPPTGSW